MQVNEQVVVSWRGRGCSMGVLVSAAKSGRAGKTWGDRGGCGQEDLRRWGAAICKMQELRLGKLWGTQEPLPESLGDAGATTEDLGDVDLGRVWGMWEPGGWEGPGSRPGSYQGGCAGGLDTR